MLYALGEYAHGVVRVEALGFVSDEREVTVTFADRRWIFPRGDCMLLPVANTTTELLARWIGHRLLDDLQARSGIRPQRIRIAVDENHGQWGYCELSGTS